MRHRAGVALRLCLAAFMAWAAATKLHNAVDRSVYYWFAATAEVVLAVLLAAGRSAQVGALLTLGGFSGAALASAALVVKGYGDVTCGCLGTPSMARGTAMCPE